MIHGVEFVARLKSPSCFSHDLWRGVWSVNQGISADQSENKQILCNYKQTNKTQVREVGDFSDEFFKDAFKKPLEAPGGGDIIKSASGADMYSKTFNSRDDPTPLRKRTENTSIYHQTTMYSCIMNVVRRL
jgi:hypothetical protein